MPEAGRVVEVRSLREGSGYLITDRLVLTAWHVIRPEAGEPLPPVRVRVETRITPGASPSSVEEPARVLWPQEDPGGDLDFALLLLEDPLPVRPVSWAALADSGRLEVQAIGYPDASIAHARRTRDTKEVSGWIRLGDRVRERKHGRGTLEIRIPDEDQPHGSPALAWPSMSGAAVFAGGVLIGVISLASTRNERGVLDALPVDRLLMREDVQAALAQAGAELPVRVGPAGAPVVQRLSYQWPQAWDFEAYMQEKRGDCFAGREWLFREIDAWRESGESRALLIRADFGVGKSALLSQYVHLHRPDPVLAWHFCQHDTQATLRPGTFVRSLATQLGESLPAYRRLVEASLDLQRVLDEADSDPASSLEAAVLAPLARLPAPQGARILVVDALDEALEVGGERRTTIIDLLARKAGRFPVWLRLLVSSRPHPAVLTPLASAFAPREIDAGSAGNQEDLKRFIQVQCTKTALQERLAAAGMSPESFTEVLLRHSGGKFLFVVHALQDVAGGSLSPRQLAALPAGMDAFYLDFFRRRFGERAESYADVAPLLGVVCAAAEPLTRAEVAEVLQSTQRKVQAIHARVPDFLRLRAERLNFDHASLREWLTQEGEDGMPRASVFAVDLEEAQSRLSAWARRRVETQTAHESPYLLRNLAAHLPSAAERRTVYAQLLFRDFAWSSARLAAADVPGLLADAQHLTGEPEHGMFLDLLHSSELALRRSTAQWGAQVLGRLGPTAPLGLAALVGSAQRWLAQKGHAQILVPATRSLRWVSGQAGVLDGQAPILVLPDGRIVSEGSGHALRVADPSRRTAGADYPGHTRSITALALLADGRVVSGSNDRTVRVWDLSGNMTPLIFKGHSRAVLALAVLPDGRIASAGDTTVRVWEAVAQGTPLILKGHGETVQALAVLKDGRLVSGADEGELRVWDLARPTEPMVLEGHESRVVSLLALPDGRFVSSAWDYTVRVWDPSGRQAPRVLEGHEGAVGPLVRLPDGRVASGADDGHVRIWDPDERHPPQVLEGHSDWVWALAVLADGRIVSGGHDNTVRVWHSRRGAPAREPVVFGGHSGKIRAVAVLPDGRVASCGDDNKIRVWDPARQASGAELQAEPAAVDALVGLPDGRLAWNGPGDTIQVGDPQGGVTVWSGHSGEVRALAVLPDGRVVSAARDRTVRVWGDEEEPLILKGHAGAVDTLAVMADGRVVSGGWDRHLRVWDLSRPRESQVLKGHEDRVRALAVLRDGRIASGAADATIRVWDLESPEEPLVLEGHAGWVRAIAQLPDGRLISASRDQTLRVWDLKRPEDCLVLSAHGGTVRALVLLRDGRIASGAADGTVCLWDLQQPQNPQVLSGHDGEVRALALLPDGRLVSGGDDSTVRVWWESVRPETTEGPQSFIADTEVLSLAVSSTGLVGAGCRDGTVHWLRTVM